MLSLDNIKTIASRATCSEFVTVINHSLKAYSKKPVGHLGSHLSLEITFDRTEKNNAETRKFFAKVLPQQDGHQLKFIQERNLFKQESAYYNVVLPLLREDFVGDDWCSKCFLANNEVIVLEDLHNRNYSILDNLILDGKHLKAAIKAQARLHAASILAEVRIKDSLKNTSPESCVDQVFRDEVRDSIDLLADLTHKIAQKLGYGDLRFKSLLVKGFTKIYDQSLNRCRLHRVICHGDTWPKNYLFSQNENGELKCIMVDFQFTRYVSQAYDLVQFIYLSTTADIRMKEEKSVITTYHEELSATLKINNPDVPIPSLSDLFEEYEDLRLSALFAAVLYYPTIYVNPKLLTHIDPDELHEKLFARTNNDFLIELYDKDIFYASQLNGLVHELIKYHRM